MPLTSKSCLRTWPCYSVRISAFNVGLSDGIRASHRVGTVPIPPIGLVYFFWAGVWLVYGWFMALVSDIEPKAVDVSSPFNKSRS